MSLRINNDPCVVIQGPKWSERSRVVNWMNAAASLNRKFKGGDWSPEHSDLLSELDFADSAIELVSTFTDKLAVVSVRWPLGCEFALLAQLGFFKLHKGRYCFSVPKNAPDADRIMDVVAKLNETSEAKQFRPEKFVATQPFLEAMKGPWKPCRSSERNPLMVFLDNCDDCARRDTIEWSIDVVICD